MNAEVVGSYPTEHPYAPVAQRMEQIVSTDKVGGSSPSWGTRSEVDKATKPVLQCYNCAIEDNIKYRATIEFR